MGTRIRLQFTGERVGGDYDYIIGDDVWRELPDLVAPLDFDKIVVVTDENVNRFYGSSLFKMLRLFPRSDRVVLPAGEGMKRLPVAEQLIERLLSCGASEYSLLIGIGGGCIGNLATFVACTYFRGIRHIQIPTTLIAMADSVIGHKGAVNVGDIKNACGVFHPPEFIYADLNFLESLPAREINNGLAEIIKHGLIEPNSLLTRLEAVDFRRASLSPNSSRELLQETLASRMRLASNDLLELREGALLQCGHVIGRAIELICPDLLHGEAVAIGLVEETKLGIAAGFPLNKELPGKISALLDQYGLPTDMPTGIDSELLIAQLSRDRRHTPEGGARFVFLEDTGRPYTRGNNYWHPVTRESLSAWLKTGRAPKATRS